MKRVAALAIGAFLSLPSSFHAAEEISMSAYDALQGMFLQIGAQALLNDMKEDESLTLEHSEKIREIESDIAEIKDILRFLAREISVEKQPEGEGFETLEKSVFLIQNAKRIEGIKENAQELKKSLYEVRSQTPDETVRTVHEGGFELMEFTPTTYILRQEAPLYAAPYAMQPVGHWSQDVRFTAFQKHGNKLRVSGLIGTDGWRMAKETFWIEERYVKVYGKSEGVMTEAPAIKAAKKEPEMLPSPQPMPLDLSEHSALGMSENELRSSIFEVVRDAALMDAPEGGARMESWEEGKLFTAHGIEGNRIRVSGHFIEGHWTEMGKNLWIDADFMRKVK